VRPDRALRALRSAREGAPTALLVPVAVAEPYVELAADGMPAHVTVIYPFVGSRRVAPALIDELRDVLGRRRAFDFALSAIGRFPGVAYLAPEPAAPFVQLVEACVARWPERPPFAGAFRETVPHVTIRWGDLDAGEERRIAAALPLPARASCVWLMARVGGRWTRRATIPLAASAATRPGVMTATAANPSSRYGR